MQRIRQKTPWILAGTASAMIHLAALLCMQITIGDPGNPRIDVYLQERIPKASNPVTEQQHLRAQSDTQKTLHDEVIRGATSTSDEPYFFSANVMERHPFPASSPRPEGFLSDVELPAAVVQLRLFIDAQGRVLRIENLSPELLGTKAEAGLRAMFLATHFIPGNIHGIDLPSYMDIEIDLRDQIF